MSIKEGITREELARRVEAAVKDIPTLDKMAWKTIYASLARERRRVTDLLSTVDTLLSDNDPDVRQWRGELKGKITHITRVMTEIGEQGRNMLMKGVGRNIFVVEDDKRKPDAEVAAT